MDDQEEVQLISQSIKQNALEGIKLLPKILKNPRQARREISRLERHQKTHIHRYIELERGITQ